VGLGASVRRGSSRQVLFSAWPAAASVASTADRCRRGRARQHGGLRAVPTPRPAEGVGPFRCTRRHLSPAWPTPPPRRRPTATLGRRGKPREARRPWRLLPQQKWWQRLPLTSATAPATARQRTSRRRRQLRGRQRRRRRPARPRGRRSACKGCRGCAVQDFRAMDMWATASSVNSTTGGAASTVGVDVRIFDESAGSGGDKAVCCVVDHSDVSELAIRREWAGTVVTVTTSTVRQSASLLPPAIKGELCSPPPGRSPTPAS